MGICKVRFFTIQFGCPPSLSLSYTPTHTNPSFIGIVCLLQICTSGPPFLAVWGHAQPLHLPDRCQRYPPITGLLQPTASNGFLHLIFHSSDLYPAVRPAGREGLAFSTSLYHQGPSQVPQPTPPPRHHSSPTTSGPPLGASLTTLSTSPPASMLHPPVCGAFSLPTSPAGPAEAVLPPERCFPLASAGFASQGRGEGTGSLLGPRGQSFGHNADCQPR